MSPFEPRHLAIVGLATSLLFVEARAWADCAGSAPAEKACTLEDQCPSGGVSCNGGRADFATCKSDAESRGLTLRCEIEDLSIYCPEGEQARNVGGGELRSIACAGGTFGVAAVMAIARGRRRRKPAEPER